MSVLKRPIITEKTTRLQDKVQQYGFEVALDADKGEIKAAIEKLYQVEVERVNTVIVRGKRRVRMTRRNIIHGKSPNYKKAIVTLKEGFEIDFYNHI